MSSFVVTVQAGQEPDNHRHALTDGLQKISAGLFGGVQAAIEVKWKVMPSDFAWTAGKPSTTSVVLCVVPDDLVFKDRADFMLKVNDFWVQQTGCKANELLIVTGNQTL